jgi:virginiamycin B lyase
VVTAQDTANGIVAGSDGNLWFSEQLSCASCNLPPYVGKITPDGTVSQVPLPANSPHPTAAITSGPDGNLWVTSPIAIGRLTPDGTTTAFYAGLSQRGRWTTEANDP